MRGTDAADPRLVLEIALVRLARRDAGPPLQALAERVDRLERGLAPSAAAVPGAHAPAPTQAPRAAPPVPVQPAAPAPGGPTARKKTLKEARAEHPPAAALPPEPASAPEPVAEPVAEPAEATRSRDDVHIDDVILAWAAILDQLGPSTRAAMREAQPLALDGPVLTLAVPRTHHAAATGRLQREAENIREAMRTQLGVAFKFKVVATDGFPAGTAGDAAASAETHADTSGADAPGADDPGGRVDAAGGDEPPPDDLDYVDPSEIIDAPVADVAGDSVSMLAEKLGATVVEEVSRD
jgi:DNA polymerase-3 subunit gamma/tau